MPIDLKDIEFLHGMYNATSTDDGHGDIESYESWLEKQLLSRIKVIDNLKKEDQLQEIIEENPTIISLLYKKFQHNSYNIAESFVYAEESDFLTINKTGYSHELEMKVSRSDFLADFNKKKHAMIEAVLSKKTIVTVPGCESGGLCKVPQSYTYYERIKKYPDRTINRLENPWACSVYFKKVTTVNLPNKFSFIVPEGLVSKEELPYAYGLYYVSENGKISEIKKPKFIHKEKFKKWTSLCTKYYWKTVNMRQLLIWAKQKKN